MSGTLLPNTTRASATVPFFQPFGTGGGGGGPDPSFSTITVAGQATIEGDLVGANATFSGAVVASTINAPEIINVSSINGAVYPPPGGTVPPNLSLSSLTIASGGTISLPGTQLQNDTVATGSGTFSTITADPSGAGSVSTRTVNGETFSCSTISALTSGSAPTLNAATVNLSTLIYQNGVGLVGANDGIGQPILINNNTNAIPRSYKVNIQQGTIPATPSATSTIFESFSTLRNATYRIDMPLSFSTADVNGVVYFNPTNAVLGNNCGAVDNLKSNPTFGNNAQTVSCVWKATTDDCSIEAFQIGNTGGQTVTVTCLDTGAVLTCLGSNVL